MNPRRLLLTGACTVVTGFILLPLVWVVKSALEAEGALELILRPQSLSVFTNSFILVVVVTFASIIISVPLAYITTYGDIPFRNTLTILLALPLAISVLLDTSLLLGPGARYRVYYSHSGSRNSPRYTVYSVPPS